MSIDMTKKLTGVTYKGQSMPISQPAAKGVLDGTATSISCPELGVTSLKPYRFYQFSNLRTLDLTGVTNIPDYTAYYTTILRNLTLDPNTTNIGKYAFKFSGFSSSDFNINLNNCVVGERAFEDAYIKYINGTYLDIGNNAFNKTTGNMSPIREINIKVNGPIGSSAFWGASYAKTNLDKTSIITFLDSGAFYGVGNSRNPKTVEIFDFRNSIFSVVQPNTFGYVEYWDIYFPHSVGQIRSTYAFQGIKNVNIYYNSVPSLDNTNSFQSATNFKNFFPYNLVQTAKTSTNWSSSTNNIVSSIFGYAAENTFSLGDTLPDTDADGYALTWYSDSAMTTQVTTVSDPTQMYYCSVGSQIKTPLAITEYQATCTLSDGVNTYANGDLVPIGATLTITAVGDTGYQDPYIFTLNGTTISSGDTYTATSTPIDIKCMYYDGVNSPINSTFADNTWNQISVAIQFGLHRTYWPITSGNTVSKPITLTDGTVVNMRLADGTANRYQFSDNSGYSQAVLEMDRCLPTQYRMNATGTNAGGWPASEMSTQTMDIVYNMLPNDLKPLVKQVKVPSSSGIQQSVLVYADNYCFPPAMSEVYNSYSGNAYNEGAIYEYYNGTSNSIKIKEIDSIASIWYLRSPYRSNNSYYNAVNTTGSNVRVSPENNYGVSVCLCIG